MADKVYYFYKFRLYFSVKGVSLTVFSLELWLAIDFANHTGSIAWKGIEASVGIDILLVRYLFRWKYLWKLM